jgi:hypothetical protein
MLKLGDKAKDRLSGFVGVIVQTGEYLYDKPSFGLQAEGLHEGKPIPVQWFNAERLEPVQE